MNYISYEEFKEIFKGAAGAVLDLGLLGENYDKENVELKIEAVNKNGQEKTGVMLKPKKDGGTVQAAATVYLEELHKDFMEGIERMNIEMPDFTQPLSSAIPENKAFAEAIVSFVAAVLECLHENNKLASEKLGTDFEEADDMVFNHLLDNVELELHPSHGKGEPKGCPHIMVGDIAVVYHCIIKRTGHEDGEKIFHVGITDEIMEKAGVTKDELHKAALKNTQERHPEVLTKLESGAYVVTAPGALSPAVAVLYPGVLKTLAARMGGSLHIIALNEEHALVVQKDVVPIRKAAEALVKTAELTDIFSRVVFRYDRYTEKLDVVSEIIHRDDLPGIGKFVH